MDGLLAKHIVELNRSVQRHILVLTDATHVTIQMSGNVFVNFYSLQEKTDQIRALHLFLVMIVIAVGHA